MNATFTLTRKSCAFQMAVNSASGNSWKGSVPELQLHNACDISHASVLICFAFRKPGGQFRVSVCSISRYWKGCGLDFICHVVMRRVFLLHSKLERSRLILLSELPWITHREIIARAQCYFAMCIGLLLLASWPAEMTDDAEGSFCSSDGLQT